MVVLPFFSARRKVLYLLFAAGLFILFSNFFTIPTDRIKEQIEKVPLPSWAKGKDDTTESLGLTTPYEPTDRHPISLQMSDADKRWQEYEAGRSRTFKETVAKYRQRYGRHPPPGFDTWYKFARDRQVYNIDDFEQIMDDLRPFWGLEPALIRALAARMGEDPGDGISTLFVRKHKVTRRDDGWRIETMQEMVEVFAKHLPDMDIAMNRLDQPRVTVPWEQMQALLKIEEETRSLPPEVSNNFTANLPGLGDLVNGPGDAEREDAGWYQAPGKQYMEIAKKACPPESAANGGIDLIKARLLYKTRDGGVVTNFNLSSDLCTVGPDIMDKHGLLYSASSIVNTERLVPVFGECKVNVNSDILFPANMYWRNDERYIYDGRHDLNWDNKSEKIIWRGVTSGGVQLPDNWSRMHRQRLVMALNATVQAGEDKRIAAEQPEAGGDYENFRSFRPQALLKRVSDVGFVEAWGCFPEDCSFYNDVFAMKPQMTLGKQFQSKFLVDVDGHSFSGRWRAFLQSKALGIKATIFREWHDSRLFAWRHFVPLDNQYDDIYTILTYFVGIGEGNPSERRPDEPYVARHDTEGKRLALQGREWAAKVLRNKDIEVSKIALRRLNQTD